jgi:hypothetical protein
MTRYTVVWSTGAENYLARTWVDHADQRQAIAAANTIDTQLATDPVTKAAVLQEGLRALGSPPLHVLFDVLELDRIARVVKVRLMGHPPRQHEGNGEGTPLPGHSE